MTNTDFIVIGLHGLPGVGKDTLADYLVKNHDFTKTAFANRLRSELCIAFEMPLSTFADRATKRVKHPLLTLFSCNNIEFVKFCLGRDTSDASVGDLLMLTRSPRWLMQQWGDFRRQQNPYYFVEAVRRQIEIGKNALRKNVVVTDVRTELERDLIKSNDHGFVVEVCRPDNPFSEGFDEHLTNNRLPPAQIDITLINQWDTDKMFRSMDQALTQFTFKY